MYTGTKPIHELAERAPTMPTLAVGALVLPSVEILTVTYEIRAAANEAILPAGLHPPIPPIATFVIWRSADGPLGPFQLAQTRVGCRSGMRPRAFLVSAVVDSETAGAELAGRWGFACRTGTVDLARSYDRFAATATLGGRTILAIDVVDPVPLRPGDIQWIANMNLAHTPRGLRLVQVDADYDVHRAERGRPRLAAFDGERWGEPLLDPVYPVVATFAVADVTLPKLRYVCRPEELAFFATEPAT